MLYRIFNKRLKNQLHSLTFHNIFSYIYIELDFIFKPLFLNQYITVEVIHLIHYSSKFITTIQVSAK